MIWRPEWTVKAIKDLESLDRKTRKRILEAGERLAVTGHGDVRRIQGSTGEWALRVGDWRVFFVYVPEERLVRFMAVRPRGSAYRDR